MVVVTYQGSFAPPHLGHFQCASNIAMFLLGLKLDSDIEILFMPTSDYASKSSINYDKMNNNDYISQEERYDMLEIYCSMLRMTFSKVKFNVSTIEFEIQRQLKSTATIHTLEHMREIYEDPIILAMGIDNAKELPWWSHIEKFPKLCCYFLFIGRIVDGIEDRNLTFTPASWPISTPENSIKRHYTYDELMSESPGIRNAVNKVLEYHTILSSPDGFSSSDVRACLRDGNFSDVETYCGDLVTKYLIENNICRRT